MEMSITIAKILFLAYFRGVEGDDTGMGRPEFIWGRCNKIQYQTRDHFVSAREGPMVNSRPGWYDLTLRFFLPVTLNRVLIFICGHS